MGQNEEHDETPDLPALPYNGTSGWSGSDTSQERAERMDTNGETESLQTRVLGFLLDRGAYGATWREVDLELGIGHHGSSTGTLSDLHKAQHIARLADRRGRCKIYVHPTHVNGRETEVQGRRRLRKIVVVKRSRYVQLALPFEDAA